jgi:hypothetical protein
LGAAELVQAMTQMVAGLGPLVDSLLQAAPALAGGLTVATWVIWSIGSVLLVLLGAGLHLLIALWRRRSGSGAGPRPALRWRQADCAASSLSSSTRIPDPINRVTMDTSTLLLAILTLCLAGVTFHAWRLGQ